MKHNYLDYVPTMILNNAELWVGELAELAHSAELEGRSCSCTHRGQSTCLSLCVEKLSVMGKWALKSQYHKHSTPPPNTFFVRLINLIRIWFRFRISMNWHWHLHCEVFFLFLLELDENKQVWIQKKTRSNISW